MTLECKNNSKNIFVRDTQPVIKNDSAKKK